MEQEIKRSEWERETGKAVSLLSLLLSCQKCAESSVSTHTLSSLFFFNDILGEVTAKFLCVSFTDCESEGIWGSIHLHHNSDTNLACYHRNTVHDHGFVFKRKYMILSMMTAPMI